jgi:hypothetical protein
VTEKPIGIGAGRRKTLLSIEEKDCLIPIDDLDDITAMIETVKEITIPGVLSPPQRTIEEIESVYSRLPDEARVHYARDKRLLQQINVARRQFNDWMGKRKRVAEMPSPMEAGRSKYPMQKAQKRSRLERRAWKELDEKIDSVRSAAQGAEQRALNAIGSSVAEQTKERREQQQTEMREQLDAGTIVKFRNPQLQAGQVVRVNQKSVRVQYLNPLAGTLCPVTGEEEPEELEDRVQLDSEHLERLEADTIQQGEELIEQLKEQRKQC